MHSSESCQTIFSKAPKAFYAVNMAAAMVHSKMLGVTHINQSIIASPTIRMDDRLQPNLSSYNGLQRLLGAI